jgi:hypothetical protein
VVVVNPDRHNGDKVEPWASPESAWHIYGGDSTGCCSREKTGRLAWLLNGGGFCFQTWYLTIRHDHPVVRRC